VRSVSLRSVSVRSVSVRTCGPCSCGLWRALQRLVSWSSIRAVRRPIPLRRNGQPAGMTSPPAAQACELPRNCLNVFPRVSSPSFGSPFQGSLYADVPRSSRLNPGSSTQAIAERGPDHGRATRDGSGPEARFLLESPRALPRDLVPIRFLARPSGRGSGCWARKNGRQGWSLNHQVPPITNGAGSVTFTLPSTGVAFSVPAGHPLHIS
jgi:hypothetical protein